MTEARSFCFYDTIRFYCTHGYGMCIASHCFVELSAFCIFLLYALLSGYWSWRWSLIVRPGINQGASSRGNGPGSQLDSDVHCPIAITLTSITALPLEAVIFNLGPVD
jgi:hypothetical protein